MHVSNIFTNKLNTQNRPLSNTPQRTWLTWNCLVKHVNLSYFDSFVIFHCGTREVLVFVYASLCSELYLLTGARDRYARKYTPLYGIRTPQGKFKGSRLILQGLSV